MQEGLECVAMSWSRPFKKNGSLNRWKFIEIDGKSMKQLHYYNRKFGKWIASKDFGGNLIIRPHRGGENHVRREWSGWQ